MKDLATRLSELRRPGLLIRAARAGQVSYNRTAHLRRVLGTSSEIRSADAVMRLMDIEAEIDSARRSDAAYYSAVRHVDVLVALVAEAALLKTTSA
jgi:hypothetical protein